MAGARYGMYELTRHGMAGARHGHSMGTAWHGMARHAMCELAFILPNSSLTPCSLFHPSEFTAIKPSSVGVFMNHPLGYLQGK